ESQQHTGFGKHEATADFGKHTVKVNWNGQDGKPFATEERTLPVRNAKEGGLIDFDSTLTTDLDKVRLDGDPQHAGFHFRANAAVEKTKDETYFQSPAGKGEKGKETNWVPDKKTGPTDRPWTAMSFVIGGKRYTVVYLD